MPERVYECERSEAEALKKTLEYDPYLDPKLIPASKGEKDLKAMSDEEREKAKEEEEKVREALDKLSKDKYANVIFARQDCSLRDGTTLDLDGNRFYLYLNASDQFLELAEERFKREFKTVKRAGKAEEEKVIGIIKAEEEKANAGFGSIFGN
jgi:hypothetical protein